MAYNPAGARPFDAPPKFAGKCGAVWAKRSDVTCTRGSGHSDYHMSAQFMMFDPEEVAPVALREEIPDNTPKVEGVTAADATAHFGRLLDQKVPKSDGSGETRPLDTDEFKSQAKNFWLVTADADFEKCWAKAVQRSAVDLVALGSMFGAKTEKQRIQWGIAFYACGKAARIAGRIQSGQDPNPDDVLDLRVYSFMFAYVEQFGGWPWPTT